MLATTGPAAPAAGPDPPPAPFLALLPAVRRAAEARFQFVRCPGRRADLVAEAVALAFAWHARLVARGRDPVRFAVTFARLAALAAGAGRRLCGQDPAAEPLSPRCRARHDVRVLSLPYGDPAGAPEMADALTDNMKSPVPAQVQFRFDFPAWLGRQSPARRRLIGLLALGHRTLDAARLIGISPARVSQLRRQFRADYLAFLEHGPGR
jgi:hypothetical protein